jgi:lactoylglutathione lyase
MTAYHRIDHVALHVSDLARSVAFYEKNFGFETYARDHVERLKLDIAYLRMGDTVLELTGRADDKMSGFHFCLETDDFDGAVETLMKAGVEVATPPHPTMPRTQREQGWRRVVFYGPDRELIEIRG